ncbi:MAG: hypothetical protein ACREDC_10395 [Bradyrhizobium sp.]
MSSDRAQYRRQRGAGSASVVPTEADPTGRDESGAPATTGGRALDANALDANGEARGPSTPGSPIASVQAGSPSRQSWVSAVI